MVLTSPDPTRTLNAIAERVRTLTGTLSCDFANGRIGMHHNGYEHRARVLRQITARQQRIRQDQVRIAEQMR